MTAYLYFIIVKWAHITISFSRFYYIYFYFYSCFVCYSFYRR